MLIVASIQRIKKSSSCIGLGLFGWVKLVCVSLDQFGSDQVRSAAMKPQQRKTIDKNGMGTGSPPQLQSRTSQLFD